MRLRFSHSVVRVSALVLLSLGLVAGLFPVLSKSGIDSLAVSRSDSAASEDTGAQDDLATDRRIRKLAVERTELRTQVTQARADAQTIAGAATGELQTRVKDAEAKAQARADEQRKAKEAQEAAARKAAEEDEPESELEVPVDCETYSGNRQIGCSLLGWAGFGTDQMTCLEKLWTKESGWRLNAQNPSGAYGIPQALPGSKMAAYGDDWQSNPETQIKWGLQYIKGRYKTPCGAWSYFQSNGWY